MPRALCSACSRCSAASTIANLRSAASAACREYRQALSWTRPWKKCSASRSRWASSFARSPLDRLTGADVQISPPAVRQPLVGGVAHQRVAEAVEAGAVLGHELAQPPPGRRAGRGRLVQKLLREGGAEPQPQHRRHAQQAAVGRRQLVDLRRHHRLHRVRQPLGGARHTRRAQQLLQEQRVAARSAGEDRHLVRAKRRILGCSDQQLDHLLLRQRVEVQRHRGPAGRRCEPGSLVAPGDADQPRPPGHLAAELEQQVTGRLVHPVRVLDGDQRRAAEDAAQELRHHLVQPRPAELLAELFHVRVRRHVQVERDTQQRQPGGKLRGAAPHHVHQPRHDRLARCVGIHLQRLQQQRAQRRVGRRRAVQVAAGRQQPHLAAHLAHRGQHPRLSDPGRPDDLDDRALSLQRGADGALQDRRSRNRVPPWAARARRWSTSRPAGGRSPTRRPGASCP